tara:strand:- start:21 stop:629 length:609 start_codon:yes stop_codon:yes gene_type:complete
MKKLNEVGLNSFAPGSDASSLGTFKSPIGKLSPHTGADSWFSQYSQSPPNYIPPEDEEEYEDEDEIILECRVYKNGKYCLIETLDNIKEFNYATKFGEMMNKISKQSLNRTSDIDTLPTAKDIVAKGVKNEDTQDEDLNTLDEFSGAAAGGGGPVPPIGYTAKGKPETPTQRRRRQRFNVTKSYPYTKLANPPRSRKKRRKK